MPLFIVQHSINTFTNNSSRTRYWLFSPKQTVPKNTYIEIQTTLIISVVIYLSQKRQMSVHVRMYTYSVFRSFRSFISPIIRPLFANSVTYVTVSAKTVLNGTFIIITRKTNLKYSSYCGSVVLVFSHARFTV